MQRIHSSDRGLSVMDYRSDGTGQQILGMESHGDFVHVRTATGQHSYVSSTLSPDIALAAYQWLGRWLQAQGIQLSVWTGGA
jgi:hypothetical protein